MFKLNKHMRVMRARLKRQHDRTIKAKAIARKRAKTVQDFEPQTVWDGKFDVSKHGPEKDQAVPRKVASQPGNNDNTNRRNMMTISDDLTPDELDSKLESFKRMEAGREIEIEGRLEEGDEDFSDESRGGDEDSGNIQLGTGATFFKDSTRSPAKARLLFYINSGMYGFQEYKDFRREFEGAEIDVEAIRKELQAEAMEDDEWAGFVTQFLRCHSYTDGHQYACGCCGMKLLEREMFPRVVFERLYLDEPAAEILLCEDKVKTEVSRLRKYGKIHIPINERWDMKEVEVWKAMSVYVEDRPNGERMWSLHPELVETDEVDGRLFTRMCPVCIHCVKHKKIPTKPTYSLAKGIDFGFSDRIGLERPNLHEQMILAKTRLYFTALKVSPNVCKVVDRASSNYCKCHAILFPNDSHQVAAYMYNDDMFADNGLLEETGLRELMKIFMMDPDGHPDKMFIELFGSHSIIGRSYVVAQYLLVLRLLHGRYSSLKVDRIEKVKYAIDKLKDEMEKNVVFLDDEIVNKYDENIGADIAEVQHVELTNPVEVARRVREIEDRDINGGENALTFSCILRTEEAHLMEDENDFRVKGLREIVEHAEGHLCVSTEEIDTMMFNKDKVDDYLRKNPFGLQGSATRAELPMCDFSKDDEGITTCFPTVFLLGRAYGRPCGRLGNDALAHLLNQFTNIPGEDRRLQGFLYDVQTRIEVMDGVKNYVNNTKGALEEIKQLLDKKEKRVELIRALDNPYWRSSKVVQNKYMKHLKYASKNVSYGATEGHKMKNEIIACAKRFSTPTCFLTIMCSILDNPRAVRLAFTYKNNKCFPAMFEEGCRFGLNGTSFMERFVDNGSFASDGTVELPKDMRAKIASRNPAAFVVELKMLLSDIVILLLGSSIEHPGFYAKKFGKTVRKTKYYKARKGVMGHNLGHNSVGEASDRGYIHWHINLTSGISARLLQRMSDLPEICNKISCVLDRFYRSELPRAIHAGELVKKAISDNQARWGVNDDIIKSCEMPNPFCSFARGYNRIEEGEMNPKWSSPSIQKQINEQAAARNMHKRKHGSRCFQGLYGLTGCAMGMPQGCIPRTDPVRLKPRIITPGEETATNTRRESNRPTPPYTVEQCATPNELDPIRKHHLQNILGFAQTNDVVVWETKRPIIDLGPFLVEIQNVTKECRKGHILNALRTVLNDCVQFQDGESRFWMWAKEDALPEQLEGLYNYVRAKLPNSNGFVAAFNPTLSFCLGSHNNACLLGSTDQAKSAMFYLIPYENKNKCPLTQVLPILQTSLDHIKRYKSKSTSDRGTIERTMKHYLTRVLNQMNLSKEVSDYLVAGKLLGLPSNFSSEIYAYYNPKAALTLIRKMDIEEDTVEFAHRMCEEAGVRASVINGTMRWTESESRNEFADQEGHVNADRYDANRSDILLSGTRLNEATRDDIGFINRFTINLADSPSNPMRDVLVPSVLLYYYRNEELRTLSYYEYTACVEFLNVLPPKKVDKKEETNMSYQKKFRLDTRSNMYHDGYHVLRKKQTTPIAIGRIPPHPGTEPEIGDSEASKVSHSNWLQRANEFAAYYLAAFRPFSIDDNFEFDWDELVGWVSANESDSAVIATFRNMLLFNHLTALKSSEPKRKLTSAYRYRERDLWDDVKRTQIANDRWQKEQADRRRRSNQLEEFLYTNSGLPSMGSVMKQLEYDTAQSNALARLTAEGGANSGQYSTSEIRKKFLCPISARVIVCKINRLAAFKPATVVLDEMGLPPEIPTGSVAARRNAMLRIFHELEPSGKSTQQTRLLWAFSRHLMGNGNKRCLPFPRIVIIHGGPGMGKSTLRNAIMDLARVCGRYSLKVSYNAVNAAEMNGDTIASFVQSDPQKHMREKGTFNAEVIDQIRKMGFRLTSIVVVEEFETSAPWHLCRFSNACQIANRNTAPNGGCITFLIGDVTQLTPVKAGPSITQAIMDINLSPDLRKRATSGPRRLRAMKSIIPEKKYEDMKYNANSPYVLGTNMLTEHARMYELTQQRRAEGDKGQSALIDHTYMGKDLSIDLFRNHKCKHLDKDDMRKSEWMLCPVLCKTNRERYTLQYERAKAYAKFLGLPLVRWRTLFRKWINEPSLSFRDQAMMDPCFYEQFVPDAYAFFKSSYMKYLKLINGTRLRYVSLMFEAKDRTVFNSLVAQARPGEDVVLPFTPFAIIVELFLPAMADKEIVKFLYNESLDRLKPPLHGPWRIIIPVHQYGYNENSNHTPVYGGEGFQPSKVLLRSRFPMEMAFALTVYKALGATMDQVIVALSHNPCPGCDMSYREVHVAISRVRANKYLRLLLVGESESERWHSLSYLSHLKQDPSIKYFFDGFRGRGNADPNANWAGNSWSAVRANAEFRDDIANR